MNDAEQFNAPWSKSLVGSSIVGSAIILVGAIVLWPRHRLVALLVIAVLVHAALFTIRGYAITEDSIVIRRLLWNTRVGRKDFQSASFEPRAIRWSIRLFGNGGLFSACGWFRNSNIGTYHAFLTDGKRAVVLRYTTPYRSWVVVVSPHDPERFARLLTDGKA